ncbi:hypothetical protein M5D96_003340 [Drosophila gunungcola]|uniref:Uncharacterized protein n=1 Tax=Drosophila gunungcola TaxID=103775 RepID=A0A9P9YRX0_9MUSC|nr:hypothetical protein M5D96_003340 [Drosophila gunungcola]
MYYELEQLIVLQENCITFWKYSKVFNVLHQPRRQPSFDGTRKSPAAQLHHPYARNSKDEEQELQVGPRWVYLGRVRRLTNGGLQTLKIGAFNNFFSVTLYRN